MCWFIVEVPSVLAWDFSWCAFWKSISATVSPHSSEIRKYNAIQQNFYGVKYDCVCNVFYWIVVYTRKKVVIKVIIIHKYFIPMHTKQLVLGLTAFFVPRIE